MSKRLCECVSCRDIVERATLVVERQIADGECPVAICGSAAAMQMAVLTYLQATGEFEKPEQGVALMDVVKEVLVLATLMDKEFCRSNVRRMKDAIARYEKATEEEQNLPKGD